VLQLLPFGILDCLQLLPGDILFGTRGPLRTWRLSARNLPSAASAEQPLQLPRLGVLDLADVPPSLGIALLDLLDAASRALA